MWMVRRVLSVVLSHADAKVGFGPGWKHHVPAYVESIASSFQSAECVKAAFTRDAARPRKIATLRSKYVGSIRRRQR